MRLGSPRSPDEGTRIGTVRMAQQAAGVAGALLAERGDRIA